MASQGTADAEAHAGASPVPTPEALEAMRRRRLEREAWFARQEADDVVLEAAKAAQSAASEAAAAFRMPKAREPKRNVTHWDMVLKEMAWLQKELSKESKARQAGARRCAMEIQKKNLGLGGREARRKAELEKQRRATASQIAKGIKTFWKKVEKVVMYRAQQSAATKRKAALDEHLDFLVGQTEKYTSHIKSTLKIRDGTGGVAAEALPSRATTPATSIRAFSEHDDREYDAGTDAENEVDDEATLEEEERMAAEAGEDDPEAELDDLANEADIPIEELLKKYYGAGAAPGGDAGAPAEAANEGEGGGSDAGGAAGGSSGGRAGTQGPAAAAIQEAADEDEAMEDAEQAVLVSGAETAPDDVGDEYAASGDEEPDDEATLEEEERLAAEAGEDDPEAELDDLANDADMPIEELLKKYYGGGGPPAGGDAGPSDGADTSARAGEAGPSANGAGPSVSAPQAEQAVLVSGAETAPDDVGDEYAASGDEEPDDEATLEEEERLAAEAGEDDPEAELDDLANDADVPIEELLKKYYGGGGPPAGGDAGPSDGADTSARAGEAGPSANGAGPSVSAPQAEQAVLVSGAETAPDDVGDEYAASGDEEPDDEATLEEEERLAAEAGEDDPEAELDDLANDADMPIEELLKKYYGAGAGAGAGSGSGGAGASGSAGGAKCHAEDEDMEDAEDEQNDTEDDLELAALYGEAEDGKEQYAKAMQVAGEAREAQPGGGGEADTINLTKVPFLLKATLRSYQHVGMDWLATVYRKNLNCILADEMGLGKTIMTISLLAWLAVERGIWGPHLVVVPTSVMINWETEFRRFCPAFKLLTYFGTQKERKEKRKGWSKPNSFHVCITTYTLVIQDAAAFKRKKWRYLILDEAHMIKNWRSQRWQTLLNFNAARRLLLTGTPLQNDLMELWSLMHFLMPHVFRSHAEFRQWFSAPIQTTVEGGADAAAQQAAANKKIVGRLHAILRPFLLRRLKCDVEKNLPPKIEHVINCRLSKRQRLLYEDFISRADVKSTLSGGNFLGVLNILMQLRKVCNHPDLFEGRAIVSAFDMPALQLHLPSLIAEATPKLAAIGALGFSPLARRLDDHPPPSWARIAAVSTEEALALAAVTPLQGEAARAAARAEAAGKLAVPVDEPPTSMACVALRGAQARQAARDRRWRAERASSLARLSQQRCMLSECHPYGSDLLAACSVPSQVALALGAVRQPRHYWAGTAALGAVAAGADPAERAVTCSEIVETFTFAIPKARAPSPQSYCSHSLAHRQLSMDRVEISAAAATAAAPELLAPFHAAAMRQQLFFPDRRLIQFDCGKLQELAELLRKLKRGGHRAIIFTQMSKMLDVLEAFINLHGHTYLRLDGTTKPEQRQILMTKYNTNPKIFLFISSTRSGGVGVNLTGADTVIFYDSDWNPAMDAQAQDRCHRIGQTRTVHIYRLITEKTIEENIKKKSDQKRLLDSLVIQQGEFNTDTLRADGEGVGDEGGMGAGAMDPRELLAGVMPGMQVGGRGARASRREMEAAMAEVDDDADAAARAAAEKEERAEQAEFADVDAIPDGDAGGSDKEGTTPRATPTPAPAGDQGATAAKSDDEMVAEIQRRAAGGSDGGAAKGDLLASLSAIERRCVSYFEKDEPLIRPDWEEKALEAVNFGRADWEMDKLELAKQEELLDVEEDPEAAVANFEGGEHDVQRDIAGYERAATLVKAQVDEEEGMLTELRFNYERVRSIAFANADAHLAAIKSGYAPPPPAAETRAAWAALREVQERWRMIKKLGMLVKLPEEMLKEPSEVAQEVFSSVRAKALKEMQEGDARAIAEAAARAARASLEGGAGPAGGAIAAKAAMAAGAANAKPRSEMGQTTAPAVKNQRIKFRHKQTVVSVQGSNDASNGAAFADSPAAGVAPPPGSAMAATPVAMPARKRKPVAGAAGSAKRSKALTVKAEPAADGIPRADTAPLGPGELSVDLVPRARVAEPVKPARKRKPREPKARKPAPEVKIESQSIAHPSGVAAQTAPATQAPPLPVLQAGARAPGQAGERTMTQQQQRPLQ